LFVAPAKERFLGFFTHHHDNAIAGEVDLANFAQLVANSLKEGDGILSECAQMTQQRPGPAQAGRCQPPGPAFLAAGYCPPLRSRILSGMGRRVNIVRVGRGSDHNCDRIQFTILLQCKL
jgi:hypothetical protein